MTASGPLGPRRRTTIQVFYDTWTVKFAQRYGTTLQAGLLKEAPDAPEDPTMSTRLLARRAGLRAGERVLDAGCGMGGPARAMAEAIDSLCVDGVTLSPVQARLATELFAASPAAPRLSVAVADFHRLPFADATFDAAVLFEAIAYSPDLPALARELARVVGDGGRVYVKDLFRPEGIDHAERTRIEAFDVLWAQAATPSLAEAISAFSDAGFGAIEAGELTLVGDDRFRGAMLDLDPDAGLRMNELGEHFLRGSSGLPLLFGELFARRR